MGSAAAASALAKLVLAESETDALAGRITRYGRLLTSMCEAAATAGVQVESLGA